MEDNDAELQLKKRARRRLVGAVAFAGFAAVVLPMIMDQEPQPAVRDVEIRIPGQDEKPFAPAFAAPAPAPSAQKPLPDVGNATAAAPKPENNGAKMPEKPLAAAAEKPVAVAVVSPTEKKDIPAKPEKAAEKPVAKPAEKAKEKAATAADPRVSAILEGKTPEAKAGQHVILIGAFSNAANVGTLQKKLSELGIRVYTENLDSPQGRKIRVRAGPFATRDAGEKALEKMKRIGVSGVLTAKP